MTERSVFFDAEGVKIEGLFEELPGERAVAISHPHPQFGGDMYNNVVDAIGRAYREEGYSTLRFNFRGVGRSEGGFDNGIGEQMDVRGALTFLSEAGKDRIHLAGYSFGAWVNALGSDDLEKADRLIMVSPPVNAIDFSFLTANPKIGLVIAGTEDHIAGAEAVEEAARTWNPEAKVALIPGADHFYWGRDEELIAVIRDHSAGQ